MAVVHGSGALTVTTGRSSRAGSSAGTVVVAASVPPSGVLISWSCVDHPVTAITVVVETSWSIPCLASSDLTPGGLDGTNCPVDDPHSPNLHLLLASTGLALPSENDTRTAITGRTSAAATLASAPPTT